MLHLRFCQKAILSIAFLFLTLPIFAQKALKTKIDFQLENSTLAQAIWQLSEESHIPVSFNDNLFDPSYTFSRTFKATSIKSILGSLLANTSARFIYANGQILIVKKAISRFTISGYIEDRETGERLIGANIFDPLSQKGTSSNEYGFFSLSLPEGKYHIRFSYLGYRTLNKELELNKNSPLKIQLSPSLTLQEIIITDNNDSLALAGSTQASSDDLPLQAMSRLPTLGGEIDVLRSLQQLPGVQPGTDGIGGLHIRGGNADQNLILFDGVPVYNPYHTIGLYSIFDFEMVQRVRFFRGQFPARFGGRISSVVDVRTRQGNNKTYHFRASTGLISSRLAIEGPFLKNKSAFYLSLRRSHLDPFLKKYSRKRRATNGQDGFSDYSFGEIIAKVDYSAGLKNHLYLSFYKGGDDYYNENSEEEDFGDFLERYKERQELTWGNTLSVLRWNHQFSEKVFANFTGNFSTFSFKSDDSYEGIFIAPDSTTDSFFQRDLYQSKIEDLSMKVDFDFVPTPRHYLRFGLHITRHRFEPGAVNIQIAGFFPNTFLSDSLNTISARELNIYIEEEWSIHPHLLINAGIYSTLFVVQQKKYLSAEPRLSLYWQVAKPLRFHFSFSQMNQYLHLLTRTGAGLPTDLWVPSTARVKPQNSLIFDIGPSLQMGRQWSFAASAYYKKMKNIINYSEGANFNFNINSDFLSSSNWENKVVAGKGFSSGLEFLLKKEKGKAQGWISYTLSKTTRQFDDLNNGEAFPFRFDLRHVFNITASLQISPRWQFSSNWSYRSGSNINLAINQWEYIDQDGIAYYYTDFGKKNSYQLTPYHRLDWDVHYRQKKNRKEWSFHIGVYNTYNRRNIFYIKSEYNPIKEQTNYKSVSIIPILPYFRLGIQL